MAITDSSQGGGGIFVHGWNHNIQIANNRVYANTGTLSGGINIGQGEFPPQYVKGSTTNADPGSCLSNGLQQQRTAAVLLQPERERPPQRGHQQLVDR